MKKPRLNKKRTETVVELEGRTLVLSNLEKVLYPAAGFTKADVIDYYSKISPYLLPHIKDRPFTLKRYPHGVEDEFFYEKQCPSHHPHWISTAGIPSMHKRKQVDYCLINSKAAIVWVANLAS